MPEWRYRGRTVTAEEIDFIRRLIADHPKASRRRLSEKLCEAWQWKQANGAPRDMVCRGLLLMLHRAGQIELPVIRFRPPNPLARRERPQAMLIDTTPLNVRALRHPPGFPATGQKNGRRAVVQQPDGTASLSWL